MHQKIQPKKAGIVGTVFGSLLIGIPAIPLVATAQTSPVLNPCPKIYYEEPFNSTRLSPEGCPPNQATQQLTLNQQPSDTVAGQNPSTEPGANLTPDAIVPADAPTTPARVAPTPSQPGVAVRGGTPGVSNPPGTAETLPVKPPLPENRSQAIASVMPTNGNVSVRLKNNTNALVTYEAIGHTGRRSLPGGEEVVLRNLPVPVTITTVRQDNGIVDVTPVSSEQGVLEVSLNESQNLDDNAGVLRIQKDGQVFLN